MKTRQTWKQWRDTDVEVSDRGQVRSSTNHRHHYKVVLNNSGYEIVHLCVGKKSVMVPVHRMVAEAFVANPGNMKEIDHIDRNKRNNSACNLRWVTHKENTHNVGVKQRQAVRAYKDGGLIDIFDTAAEAKRWLGVTGQGVDACCKGYQKACKGYTFKYDGGEAEQFLLF